MLCCLTHTPLFQVLRNNLFIKGFKDKAVFEYNDYPQPCSEEYIQSVKEVRMRHNCFVDNAGTMTC